MTHEMISGPDLGGGYLHQLSFDTEGESTTFTFHAQVGGADAGGPPRGSLDVFGFVVTPTPCMFGGPRCWHRRFLLPRSEAPRVRAAYNRDRFVLDTMIAQSRGETAPPIDESLGEVVRRLADPLAAAGVTWWVGGSAAARLLGAAVGPRDIDLGTGRSGVDRIAGLLADYLIEPLGSTDWPGRGIVRGARAFVGSLGRGVRVEWAVALDPGPAARWGEWDDGPEGVRSTLVTVDGRTLRVSRPEYALVRAAEKGDPSRRGEIAALVRARGADRELLRTLLGRSTLPETGREVVLAEAGVATDAAPPHLRVEP